MDLDIRIPIASLFLLYGLLLTVFGAFSGVFTHPLLFAINLNLCWGLVLLAFGGLMLSLALRKVSPSR